MDTETKAAFLELCELCQESLRSASETRLIALRIHEALVKARVPGYLQAHEYIDTDSSRFEAARHELQTLIERVISKAVKLFEP